MLFLFLAPGLGVNAQQTEDQKLLSQISKEPNDTSRIKLMMLYLTHFAPIPEHKKWFNKIDSLSHIKNYRPGLAYHLLFEGLQLSEKGKFDDAIAHAINCIDCLDSLRIIQGYADPLYQLRFIYNQAGRNIEMFQYYSDKIGYYKQHGPIQNTSACYHSLGLYYSSLADYDKAIGYFLQALEVYRSFDPMGAMNETMSIGFAYLGWGNLEKAEFYLKTELYAQLQHYPMNIEYDDILGDLYVCKFEYRKALQCYLDQKKNISMMHHFHQANNKLKIASAYLHLGAFDSARIYLESADSMRQKDQSNIYFANGLGDIDYGYYEYYNAMGHKKSALRCLESALRNARLSEDATVILKITNELHYFFLKNGDSLQALRYLVQYNTLQDSINKMHNQTRIASFEIEQQQQVKENEIEHLQLQKKEQRNYYLFGGAFLLLIVMAVIILILYRRKRDKAQLTSDFKNQLARAETKALRSQMNPHFIFNSLNSINNFVTDQKHEIASDYLLRFSKLIRLILDNSRSESIPLDRELETLQLYVELESIRFENHFKYEVNIAENTSTGSIMIPPMLLQPFIENAIWHGLMQKRTKGTIAVDIRMENENFLHISITDDGIGREKAAEMKSKSATHQSHGLKVTSERIDMMNKLHSTGARVHIIDLKDEHGNALGTRVELIIPV